MDIPGGSLGAGLEADFWTEMPGGSRGGCPDMMKVPGFRSSRVSEMQDLVFGSQAWNDENSSSKGCHDCYETLFAFVSLFTSLRLTIIELEWLEHVDRLINVSKSTTTRLVSHLPLHIQVTRYNMCQF